MLLIQFLFIGAIRGLEVPVWMTGVNNIVNMWGLFTVNTMQLGTFPFSTATRIMALGPWNTPWQTCCSTCWSLPPPSLQAFRPLRIWGLCPHLLHPPLTPPYIQTLPTRALGKDPPTVHRCCWLVAMEEWRCVNPLWGQSYHALSVYGLCEQIECFWLFIHMLWSELN